MKTKLFRQLVLCGMILLAAAFWNGCSTVPVTGRSQLNLLSPGEELQLGLTSFQQTKKVTV